MDCATVTGVRSSFRFRMARGVLRLGVAAVLPTDVVGLEGLPHGPYVLSCNHLNWVDPFLLIAALPARPSLHFLGRRSAVHNRFWKRWFLFLMGDVVIPVESGEIARVSEAVGGVLQGGQAVGIFPEGRIGSVEGELQPLRPGVAHFAGAAGVPIVPAALSGTRELWRRKRIRLVLGPALQATGDVAEDMAALETRMRAVLPVYEEARGPRPWPWLTTLLK
ncbi:MAG: 1-acyl-sn-glycerol-3-phosphate acyltransferase [Candidatus Dormibacteraeota bacterium]|nr:1-acyl-sn-glycerol-3-phosphate acyltransferase [Candidatus Dormibacteraeota bacterium]